MSYCQADHVVQVEFRGIWHKKLGVKAQKRLPVRPERIFRRVTTVPASAADNEICPGLD